MATVRLVSGLSSGSIFPFGVSSVTYEAASASGAWPADRCTFQVVVRDIRVPVVKCPKTVFKPLPNPQLAAVRVQYPTPVFEDFYNALANRTGGLASNSYFPLGTTVVEFTAVNSIGFSATCTFNVTVTKLNFVICLDDIEVTITADTVGVTPSGVPVNYTAPLAADGTVPTLLTGGLPGSYFAFGNTNVTYEVAGLAPCTFSVRVNDTRELSLVCSADLASYGATQVNGLVVNYDTPKVSNPKPQQQLQLQLLAGLGSGAVFPFGSTVVRYAVLDLLGHVVQSCSFVVFVGDMTPPALTCPSPVAVVAKSGSTIATATYPLPVVSNAPTDTASQLVSGLTSGSVFPLGTTTVTYSAKAANGMLHLGGYNTRLG
jgi:hypothetical protein